MKDGISVIVPCYNVENFIEKCMDSILNQTYKNLEIILVEDCSTDNTKKIIKQYSKYDNVKLVFNKENHGLSYSRNTGLQHATKEYISFIDSDDYIDLDFYEKLMKSIIKNKSDVAVCDIKVVDEEQQRTIIEKACNSDKVSKLAIIDNGLAASACNKLFKREIISKYMFEEGKVNEDIAVVIPAIVNSDKISYVQDRYYYYIQRNGSIQNSKFSYKRFDIVHAIDLTLERITKSRERSKIKDILVYNQLIVLLLYVIPKIKDKKYRYKVLKKYNELTLKYDIRKNKYFWDFLAQSGKKHRIYYKLLVKFNCEKHYHLANMLISAYAFLYKILKTSVIDENINLNVVVEAAKHQNKLKNEKIKISVVVPNYNYSKFMHQRLYSIMSQNYKLHEIIILDDCSSDDSIEVIDKMVKKIKKYVNVKTIYNEKNSGSAFKQWEKGFKEATGDYVWIAEADDYCDKTMIRKLVKPIKKDKDIYISYADTAFIDATGRIFLKTIKPEIDIQKTGHWNKSFVNNGLDEIKNYSFLNCTIANVSSALIKKGDYSKYFKEAGKYRQAGDWVLYVNVMSLGNIAFYNKPLNYYRVHGDNITSTMKKQKHLDEIIKIHNLIETKFGLDKNQKKEIRKRYKFLKKVWNFK